MEGGDPGQGGVSGGRNGLVESASLAGRTDTGRVEADPPSEGLRVQPGWNQGPRVSPPLGQVLLGVWLSPAFTQVSSLTSASA